MNNYAAIDATPEILAGVLAVLGLAVLAQFILASGPPQAPRLRAAEGARACSAAT